MLCLWLCPDPADFTATPLPKGPEGLWPFGREGWVGLFLVFYLPFAVLWSITKLQQLSQPSPSTLVPQCPGSLGVPSPVGREKHQSWERPACAAEGLVAHFFLSLFTVSEQSFIYVQIRIDNIKLFIYYVLYWYFIISVLHCIIYSIDIINIQ